MKRIDRRHFLQAAACGALASLAGGRAARAAAPDLGTRVRDYADAMILRGRDTCGAESSPLFAAAMDRTTFGIGDAKTFGAIPGVRESDRALSGANPQQDAALYEILYALSGGGGRPDYGRAADDALRFFFEHAQSPATGLMAWGEHIFWDFRLERMGGNDLHEICGEWPFADRVHALAPEAWRRFALGLWRHQVADPETGDFSRHAKWSAHGPQKGADFPRYAGQMIVTWADVHARQPDPEFVRATTCLVSRMEGNIHPQSGLLAALRGADYAWSGSNLELARGLWKAAPAMPAELGARMNALSLRLDERFFASPHRVAAGGGFAATLHTVTGEPRTRSMNRPYTDTWATGYGYEMTAGFAAACHARAQQLADAHPETAARHRALVLAAAAIYLKSDPPAADLLKPHALAAAIDLMLQAHDLGKDPAFLARARFFAREGVALFLDDTSPLPKATNRHGHYEAITGGPDFMRALFDVHRQA